MASVGNYDDWFDHKSALMELSLGKEHDMVMHAMIPFGIGGALDLYYYPNGLPGTAIATKELSLAPNEGPRSKACSCYELVMFTRLALDLDSAKDGTTAFGKAHSSISHILNCIAQYGSEGATLNPRETGEVPPERPDAENRCIILDGFACHTDDMVQGFGLLAVIEIFRSEMDFARKNSGAKLLDRLKAKGHYPYSDLERDPVA